MLSGPKSSKPLVGRAIKRVRYLTPHERETLAISKSGVVLELDNGTLLWPMADDEGNRAGALFIQAVDGVELPQIAPTI